MKKAGWILLVFGGLSCIGALTAGGSIFGPVTFYSNRSVANKQK